MPDPFLFISRYFWVIALGFSAFNFWKADRALDSNLNADKKLEAQSYLRNFAIAGALPWAVMGAGQITGATPTVWHYFRPQDGNVFVLVWLAVIFAASCVFAWWVFMADGAKKTAEFNLMAALGQHSSKPQSEKMIKFFAVLGVVVFPAWIYLAVSMSTPLPQ